MAVRELRENTMMAHLLDALQDGEDIGHYGRLVFAMVARHFLSDKELLTWLGKNPGFSDKEALALVHQMRDHDYSPPRRETILEWQKMQEFPICPDPGDPDACNVYKDLSFPDGTYEHITDYHIHKADKEMS